MTQPASGPLPRTVALVGLGGTGAYILDLVVKTPVAEIHLYDGDVFLQHNAFRSPGAASVADLRAKLNKVDYYKDRYSPMRRHIVAESRVNSFSAVASAP